MKRATIYARNASDGDYLLRIVDDIKETAHHERHELMTDAIAVAHEHGASKILLSMGEADMAPATQLYPKG